jgi:hypothetical protein
MGLLWTVLMRREGAMRWVHLTVIILLAAATLLFVLQKSRRRDSPFWDSGSPRLSQF